MKRDGYADYYLGLDIGTDSVGYAVTDEEYHVLKFHGKSMWGSRLFETAKTAEERRQFRTGRRRIQRRTDRIQLLQELFAEEISKTDPGFFQRMKDSRFLAEDKENWQPYSLFHDKEYTDREFYQDFPTIYHLRKALIESKQKYDIRLIYLAVHHIIKHRGHFLFQGSMDAATSFSVTYQTFCQCMQDELDLELNCTSAEQLEELLKDKRISKLDKKRQILQLFQCTKKDKQLTAVIGLLCGLKGKLEEVFADASLSDMEKASISFSETSYDEIRPDLEEALQERCAVLDVIKSVYDWTVLADILADGKLGEHSYLSVAKVKNFEKHKYDLAILKKLVKEYDKDIYREFFNGSKKSTDNYSAYVGFYKKNGRKVTVHKCKREDFLKTVKKIIGKLEDSEEVQYIKREIESNTFLPLQASKDNVVIPHQIHETELKKILEGAKDHYDFLNHTDEDGICVADKILKLFQFKIPYYVGPLNTSVGENSWMIRKTTDRIRPWNFQEVVDCDKSAECFIRRMTNKCSYLLGKDVLPKNSLLYCEFTVWNELNNIKIEGEKLSVELKQIVFNNLFKRKKRITKKMFMDCLKSEGIHSNREDISGVDQMFASALVSYIDFKNIFGEDMEKYSVQQMAEECILWITLYGGEKKMLKRVIRKNYSSTQISDEQLNQICRINYQGWGRLSKEFLAETEAVNTETGENFTIIQALRQTNDNLMQLLSSRYSFAKEIASKNETMLKPVTNISYVELFKNIPASPAIKRSAWQAILITEEIRKIMGKSPKKIFVEMARGTDGKKERTISRKDRLIELYKSCQDEERDWIDELSRTPESRFRSIKLYLYYTQMGRCMYSNEPIELSQLSDATVYDRDHIYPQSLTKDDSLDNLVLVKRNINLHKSNDVLSPDIQNKMSGFWKMLKGRGLISAEKYDRLMRRTPLTDEELAGFINRQMVETRQSSKIAAGLLGQIYSESKVVYVKAKAVADFRNETLKMVKVRELNDFHHAKDAYLNIVVGNVYNEKFTDNPLQWLKNNRNKTYNLSRIFIYDVKKGERLIWKSGNSGSIAVVKKQLCSSDIRYTRYALCNKGGFFNQQPVGKDDNAGVPLKKGMDVKKYGGYKSVTPACFALVESEDKKGRAQRSIEAVPLYLKETFKKKPKLFLKYCEESYGLKNPKILIPIIKKDSYVVINGFPMHLRGTSGKQLVLQGAVQLCLPNEETVYLKKIEKYIQRNTARTDKRDLLSVTDMDAITKQENLSLYDVLCKKQGDTIYRYRPASQYEKLLAEREHFAALTVEEQCIVLNEILHLLQCKPITADLTLIGGSKAAGGIKINKMISKYSSAKLIHQSVTGLFEQEIDLLTL